MTGPTHTCPECHGHYQRHWLEPGGFGLCRSCAAERKGRCYSGGHPHHGTPCSGPSEKTGGPCRYCGKLIAGDPPCPDCTVSLEGMPLADIKALFASDDALAIGGTGPA
jgi:hypothetical protein